MIFSKMRNQANHATHNRDLAMLYKAGGIATLVAALLFRRNIGAEMSLFIGMEAIPHSAVDWFSLLRSNPFVGLSFLAVFDLFNCVLVGLMFLALAAMFWQTNKSIVAVALTSGLVGITISFASNASLTMLSLSQQYAAADSETQRAVLESAANAIVAAAGLPSTGAYMSLLLIALAGLLFSVMMFSSNRVTAIVGLLAGGCDLAYCLTFTLTPILPVYLFLAVAGLLYMIWHLLVARILLKHAQEST